jgi:TPP-dependent pyruvate/acetoin dehydrogenase alpha subunit
MAHAARVLGTDDIALACLGDGATSEGDFHVAMNFAGVWKAPVVFFCQNNQFAISVPVSAQTASATIAIKAEAYGFSGVRVDGNDAFAVYGAVKTSADRARAGEGPTLVEALTYRIGAHSSSDDPSRYRDEKVTEEWRTKRDPLRRAKAALEEAGHWSEKDETAARSEFEAEIASAVARVETLPPPPDETLFEDVYATVPWHLARQRDSFMAERRNAGSRKKSPS